MSSPVSQWCSVANLTFKEAGISWDAWVFQRGQGALGDQNRVRFFIWWIESFPSRRFDPLGPGTGSDASFAAASGPTAPGAAGQAYRSLSRPDYRRDYGSGLCWPPVSELKSQSTPQAESRGVIACCAST